MKNDTSLVYEFVHSDGVPFTVKFDFVSMKCHKRLHSPNSGRTYDINLDFSQYCEHSVSGRDLTGRDKMILDICYFCNY
jgi:hypothetical protein